MSPAGAGRIRAGILAAALAVPGPARAAEAEGVIHRIVVEGNQRLDAETILGWLSVRAGDPLDRERLREEFQNLWKRDVFGELSIEARETPEGTVVILHVREKPVISNVTYEGLKSAGVDQVEETLKQVNASLAIGAPVSQGRIQKAREVIRQLLREAGRRSARVHAEMIPISVTQQEIRFRVEEGPKTKIREIQFLGNRAISGRKLRKALRWTEPHRAWKIFSRKDTLHEARLRDDLKAVAALYESQGYLDIQIHPERILPLGGEEGEPAGAGGPSGGPGEAKPVQEGKKEKQQKEKPKKKEWVRVEVPLTEGGQYRVGSIRIRGNTVFTNAEVLDQIPLGPGEVFNDSALNAGLSRLELAYGERGYFYMATNKVLERQPDRTANVRIDVEEDEEYTVNRLEFRGNSTTRDSVLRRELPLAEDDLFNIRKFRVGLRRINQLGYWRITEEPEIRPLPGERAVDIVISGKEESRNEIQVGGGVSGVDGAFFSGSYATSNFLGRGEIFQAFLQAGGKRQLFNFSFIEPYLFGSAYTLGFNLFDRETDFLDFVQAGTGASVQVGRRIGDFSRLDFTYLFENVTVREAGFSDRESNTSSVTPVFTFNTLNNFFRPTRGYRMRFYTEVAGGALGGDNYFLKPVLENTLYLPAIKSTYFGLNAEVGWVEPFGTLNGLDREVPVFERFYLGGDRSLRAFPSRSVSPTRVETFAPTDVDGDGDLSDEDLNGNGVLDTEDVNLNGLLDPGEDLNANGLLDTEDADGDGTLDRFLAGGQVTSFPGGNKFLLLNGEFIIPVGESVEVGFFVDAGNAFDDDESLDFQDLRLDYGLETRFYLPVFQAPLRLIYGIIYDPRPGEDSSNFQFSIGRTF